MKTFLTATSLVALCAATGTVLADGPQHEEHEVRIIAGDGENRTIEVRDGVVYIDGERIETGEHGVVVIDGDEVTLHGGHDGENVLVFRNHHGAEHAARMAEHAERMAEHQAHMRVMRVDLDGMEGQIREQLEGAMAQLEENHILHGRDYEELSEEERAELREDLAEAREEIREALSELHIEMAELHEERAEAEAERRELAIELRELHVENEEERRRIIIEMREVEREAAREARDHAREIAREAREAAREAHREAMDARHERHEQRRFQIRRGDGERLEGASQSIRVEEEDNGVRRVWVDGEEQTGDDLTEWLNRLEAGELSGAPTDGERRFQRRVMRGDGENSWTFADGSGAGSWVFERGEGGHFIIELDGETIDMAELTDGEVIDLSDLEDGVTRWEDENGSRVMIIRRHEESGDQD
jgi:hypothetical protein